MIEILIHILPQEIDQLEQTLIQLKKSSKYLEKDEFLVEVVLNANLTNWGESKLSLDFFKNKMLNLEDLTKSWAKTRFWTSSNNEVLGCTDSHRIAGEKYHPEAFLWLDVDIVFSETLLYHMLESFKILKQKKEYFIITPETTRIWDSTWDPITNKECLSIPASHDNYFSRDPYLTTGLTGDTSIREINTFKFASGWFTLLSNSLTKKIIIPNEMGSYYMDDTFIMECCINGNNKGLNASQYVIENEIIIENNKFRYNPYKDYLSNIDRKQEFIDIAKQNFTPSVINFLNTL